jgi:hypothetical protein
MNSEVKGLRNVAVNGLSSRRMKIPFWISKVLWFVMITDEPYVDMLQMHVWSPDHLLSKSNCLGTSRVVFKSQQSCPDFSHHCLELNGLRAYLLFCWVDAGVSILNAQLIQHAADHSPPSLTTAEISSFCLYALILRSVSPKTALLFAIPNAINAGALSSLLNTPCKI